MEQTEDTSKRGLKAMVIGALGVVFGDIGTSPLYALKECFNPHFGLAMTPENVYGILSVVFWTLAIIVGVKYMMFVLEADNRGEGGVLALMALATMSSRTSRYNRLLFVPLGLAGAAFLFGDGVITPAISVLSAIEGLTVVTPIFERFVGPLTVGILAGLFFVQSQGTGRIGACYGPVIAVWFFALAALGIHGIVMHPQILWALNPAYAVQFFIQNHGIAFHVLAAVVLVVTGAEALYADMGHFGRSPIRWAWFSFVMPALTLNYFGQGAMLLENPEAIANPFFKLAPEPLVLPMVILATLASIIASQALISGMFSIARQAIQLGYLPRLKIIHTSRSEIGQIYVPLVNWLMLAGVTWVVFTFKTSSALAGAYGIVVTATMSITTVLAFVVSRRLWRWKWSSAFVFLTIFGIIDFTYFGATLSKIYDGGWLPIGLGLLVFIIMTTWQTGRRILVSHLKSQSLPIEMFMEQIKQKPPVRVPGCAIYMTGDPWGAPIPLLQNLKHNKVMHEKVAILTISTREIPYAKAQERVRIEELAGNFHRITAIYGFMEQPKIREILEACREKGLSFLIESTTFVLGRETIIPSNKPGMALWREKLFAVMSRNAQRPAAYFDIPVEQVIEVGIQVEI